MWSRNGETGQHSLASVAALRRPKNVHPQPGGIYCKWLRQLRMTKRPVAASSGPERPRRRGAKGDARPQGPQRRPGEEVGAPRSPTMVSIAMRSSWRTRTRRSARRAGQGSRQEDRRRRRRRHHHRHRFWPRPWFVRAAQRRGRRQPARPQARHREGRRQDPRDAAESRRRGRDPEQIAATAGSPPATRPSAILIAEAMDKVGNEGVITVEESNTFGLGSSSPRACASTRATSRVTS